MKEPNITVSGTSFQALFLPQVYHWHRGANSLYIGKGGCGWQRLLSRHKYVNRQTVHADDQIDVYYCDSDAEALLLETELIQHFRPLYNVNKGGQGKRKDDFRNSSFYR